MSKLRGMWQRYRKQLSIQEKYVISLGEGLTPLYQSPIWPNVWIKDERQNPTGTFKDRQASLIISRAKQEGIKDIVVASTGNTALAMSIYAAIAGLYVHVFLPQRSRHQHLAGANILDMTYDQVQEIAQEFARIKGFVYAQGLNYTDAMSTIAWEIEYDLGRVPDWYVQAVSGGIGPLGVYKGFHGHVKILVAQSEGCAPMVRSARKGLNEIEPTVDPSGYVVTLGSGNPAKAYRFLRQVGAAFMMVSDEEVREMAVDMEPAAGVAFAALEKALSFGIIKKDECVVVNCSGR